MSTAVETQEPLERIQPFEHVGLLYRDQQGYLAAVTGFARAALGAQAPLLIAVPADRLSLLRDALDDLRPGADAPVGYIDMATAGRNPGRILPGVLLSFAQRYPDQRVWIVGEPVWPGRSRDEYPACAIHEILINLAFAGRSAAVLCPYDVESLGDEVIADARRSHPILTDGSGRWANARYLPPDHALSLINRRLPAPPAEAARVDFADILALAEVRRFVTARAVAAGLDRERADDLALAINELATNTVRHTNAAGQAWIWSTRDMVVCQVEDTGHLADPLAGRVPRPADQPGGRGLLLVNDLCDLVRVHSEPGRTTIRVHMHR